jgi:hypothetical protein
MVACDVFARGDPVVAAVALGDDHHLLARYRQQARVLADELERALNEGIDTSVRGTRDPVDGIRARGVPIVGPGSAGGAIRGTLPHREILKLDARTRRRRRRRL